MAVPIWCSRSSVFSEFTEEEQKKYFNLSREKFIAEIDNFFYMVELDEERCKSDIEGFVNALDKLSERFDRTSQDKIDFFGFDFYPFGLKGYNYMLSKPECYDIFIRKSLPNKRTHRVWVQIRASFIWKYGVRECIKESFANVERILRYAHIKVLSVQENRIDYCFHNNAIQNPEKFFDRSKLKKHCKTNARIYNLVGNPQNNWSLDYCSIGSRRSRSVFFRVYNKTREVIEMNYKSFFIKIWFEKKLINEYDRFCLEYAFNLKSYDVGLLIGQLKWYLQFGKNEELKKELSTLYSKYFVENSNSLKIRNNIKMPIDKFVETDNYSYFRKEILNVLPPVTIITNIEYETHRDFYRSFDNGKDGKNGLLHLKNKAVAKKKILARVFQVYGCRKAFVDYLTSYGNSVSFVKDNTVSLKDFSEDDYLRFWKRLRQAKWQTNYNPDLMRSYERNIEIERIKRKFISDMAVLSIYRNGENENGLMADIYDTLGTFNDNSLHSFSFIDLDSGEIPEIKYDDHHVLKTRKNRQLRSIISSTDQSKG